MGPLVPLLLDLAPKIFDKMFPNPEDANKAKLELLKLQQEGALRELAAETELVKGQLEINKEEAKSTSLFVSGWRPFIGWACGGIYIFNYAVGPLIASLSTSLGHPFTYSPLDTAEVTTILCTILGVGGLRTIEKIKKVA